MILSVLFLAYKTYGAGGFLFPSKPLIQIPLIPVHCFFFSHPTVINSVVSKQAFLASRCEGHMEKCAASPTRCCNGTGRGEGGQSSSPSPQEPTSPRSRSQTMRGGGRGAPGGTNEVQHVDATPEAHATPILVVAGVDQGIQPVTGSRHRLTMGTGISPSSTSSSRQKITTHARYHRAIFFGSFPYDRKTISATNEMAMFRPDDKKSRPHLELFLLIKP